MASNPNKAILKYLQEQNRPYSANDILLNMHKEFGKTQIQKSLDVLSEEGKILEKVYGKQKVYSAKQQEENAEDLQKQLQEIDALSGDTANKLRAAETELKATDSKISALKSVPKTDDAAKEVEELTGRVAKLKKKLHELENNTVKISAKEREKIMKDHAEKTKEWRKRKRICMEIIDSILEGYPKDKKTLLEEIGIETDEMAGIEALK